MEHLTTEALARLVDEVPTPDERGHLNRCRRCRDEFDALQAQTMGLSHLPDLRPPRGDWESLEVRLRGEGLIRASEEWGDRGGAGSARRGQRSGQASWQRVAAAALLLALGAGAGAGGMALAADGSAGTPPGRVAAGSGVVPGSGLAALDLPAIQAALGLDARGATLSLEEAEELVQATESWYLSALLRDRDRVGAESGEGGPREWSDPVSRYAALEALMAAGQAAIREAPADPFLNGLMMNVRAEREAVLRGIRSAAASEGEWY
jgi:hypothetical protein